MLAANMGQDENNGLYSMLPSYIQGICNGPSVWHALEQRSSMSPKIEDGDGLKSQPPLPLEPSHQLRSGLTSPQDRHRLTPQPEPHQAPLHQVPQERRRC